MGGWSSSAGDAITELPVTIEQGGTETTTLTDGGILLGSGTGAITPMGVLADGAIVVGDGTTDPVTLAAFSSSTGDLTLAAGGTGASLSAVNGGILYCGASVMALSAAGSSGQIFQSAGAATPVWSTATYPATTTINQLLYSSAANTVAGLATLASGVLVTGAGAGVPVVATDIPTGVTIGGSYIYRVGGTDVAVTDGGTGVGLSTGTVAVVLSTSPTLVTPELGVATATSVAFGGGTALANYVEGTFAPTVTLVGGAGNTVPVYTTNTGRYTRIGNRVFADVYLTGDGGAEGAGTGQVNIALPVTASANHPTSVFPCGYATNAVAETMLYGQIPGSATTIALYKPTSVTVITNAFTGDDQNNAGRGIRLKFQYEV